MRKIELSIPELPFAAQEALNRLQVNMKFVGEDTRKIMLTSSIENEGKSTISIYLWKLLAEAGYKTLYVDLDLRKSVTKTRYGIKADEELKGVEHYLSGLASADEIIYETNIANAYMIPCINHIENPANLLGDRRLAQILDQSKEEYRYIIMDTPPMMAVSDCMQIARLADGVVLVVKCGFTSKEAIRQSIQAIQATGCPILGTALNKVPVSAHKYGYGYGKYNYGYGSYGYGYLPDSHSKGSKA